MLFVRIILTYNALSLENNGEHFFPKGEKAH